MASLQTATGASISAYLPTRHQSSRRCPGYSTELWTLTPPGSAGRLVVYEYRGVFARLLQSAPGDYPRFTRFYMRLGRCGQTEDYNRRMDDVIENLADSLMLLIDLSEAALDDLYDLKEAPYGSSTGIEPIDVMDEYLPRLYKAIQGLEP